MADAELLDLTAAEAYERYLVPTLNTPLAAEAITIASPRPNENVLDVACGTGIGVRLALRHIAPGGKAVGLDIDPAMIAVARSIVQTPQDVALEWHCASAMQMPFDAGAFDVAFCLQGLQFLPDCKNGLSEIRRVMKRGGRLVAIVWNAMEHCKGHHAIVQALNRHAVDSSPMLKALSMGDASRLQKNASDAGFREVRVRAVAKSARFLSARHFTEALAAGGPSSRHALSKVPEQERAEFHNEVRDSLRQYEDEKGISIPIGYLVLEARP